MRGRGLVSVWMRVLVVAGGLGTTAGCTTGGGTGTGGRDGLSASDGLTSQGDVLKADVTAGDGSGASPDAPIVPIDGGTGSTTAGTADATTGGTTGGLACLPEWTHDPLPTPDLKSLAKGYTAAGWFEVGLASVEQFYPPGKVPYLDPNAAQAKTDNVTWLQGGSAKTFNELMNALGTIVHEEVHRYGFGHGSFPKKYAFWVGQGGIDELTMTWPQNFPARSEITKFVSAAAKKGNSWYDLYLTKEGSNQGLDSVLDEFNAYTHSSQIESQLNGGVQPLFGGQTVDLWSFVLFTELYVRLLREDYAPLYAKLTADKSMMNAVLVLYRRARYVLAQPRSKALEKTDFAGLVPALKADVAANEGEMTKLAEAYCALP